MFLPTTRQEFSRLGWKSLDVILVTGDAYIDSPHVGVAVIAKVLLSAGYRVGIISQPDIHSGLDICRLGEPEHSEEHILHLMGKPGFKDLLEFKRRFDQLSRQLDKKQYLTYYFIAAYHGCTLEDMAKLRRIIRRRLGLRPQQVQIFTPSPATVATLMYYTETDPDTNRSLFVEKNIGQKEAQKKALVSHGSNVLRTAAERCGRTVRTGEQDS